MANNISIPIDFDAINRTTSTLGKVNKKIDQFAGKASKAGSAWRRAFKSPVKLFELNDAMDEVGRSFEAIIRVGSFYESQMADLSAITGLTGKTLEELGAKARKNAKVFGGEAGKSVEVYKLLLSKLGPELAKTPKVLSNMANNVSLLSKTMGGDTTAAVEVLTTAINQYSVDLTNPIVAQKTMTEMMNAMSAAAKEGTAKLPAQAAAIQKVGGVAHSAGVKFNEMLAAIQVLDKADKQGAKGGITALHNAMSIMSSGHSIEQTAKTAALEEAGVDVLGLADKTKSFTDRLRLLRPVLHDSALMGEVFGKKNRLAGEALVRSIDAQDELTNKITNTNTTQTQASVKMDTYAEKLARLKAWISDLGISFFNVSKDILPYTSMLGESVTLATHVARAVSSLGNVFKLQSLWTGILTVKQWLLNVAMNANVIGLIVLGIAALIAIIAVVIAKYDEWGAALTLILGPLGMIINMVMAFKKNWEGIVAAFKDGGIVKGLMAIGKTILDELLYPVQQILELIAEIPGLQIAGKGATKIAEWRKQLELPTPDNRAEKALKKGVETKEINDNSTVNITLNGSASKEDAEIIVNELQTAKEQGRLAYAQ